MEASAVRDLYDKGQRALRKEHRDYWLNRSFLFDDQWVSWNTTLNRLDTIARDERVRLTINRLLPSTRTVMAKLLRRPLVFEVTPSGADDASSRGARLSQSVLADAHREQNWEAIREDLAWACWQGGTALCAMDWDPSAGTPLGQTDSGKEFGLGDVCLTPLTIIEAVTEPGVRDVERARYWIKACALPPSEVQATYKMETSPAADVTAALSPSQHKLMTLDGEVPVDLTLVLTYYERPNPKNPKGEVSVVVGSTVVDGPHPWPYPFTDRLNVVAVRESRVFGRWTGATVLTSARSPQTALNQSMSALVEHMRNAGNARITVPTGAVDYPEDTFTDEPGEVIQYNPIGGGKPEWMSPPTMPQWWVDQPAMLEKEIDDILGVHDISRGEAPSNVGSGVALSLLAEQDDTPVGRLAKEFAEAWGRLATLVLRTYAAKVTETRTATVQTPGNRPDQQTWTGKDLLGQTTAVVPLEAVQPRSRAASFQLAIQLKGLYPDLPLAVFSSVADLPGADSLLQGVDANAANARWENGELAKGDPLLPEDFDDHAIHISEHNRFRMSVRYREASEEIRSVVDDHVAAHEALAGKETALAQMEAVTDPDLAASAQAHEPAPVAAPDPMGEALQPALDTEPEPLA